MNYKIVNKPLIPDASMIRKHQNFELLLNKIDSKPISKPYKGFDVLSILLSLSLVGYALNNNYGIPTTKPIVTAEKLSAPSEPGGSRLIVPIAPKKSLSKENREDSTISKKSTTAQEQKIPVQKKQNAKVSTEKPAAYSSAFPKKGFDSLYKYFSDSLNYPTKAEGSGVFGEVMVEFTIAANGDVFGIRVIQSLGESFDKEAIRLIKNMPAWQPAMINGHPIKSKLSLPLIFESDSSKN